MKTVTIENECRNKISGTEVHEVVSVADELNVFLKGHNLCPGDIDVFVNGASGDIVKDQWNMDIHRTCFEHAAEVRFKHLSGEYATASSFALWLGAMILKRRQIPDAVRAEPVHPVKKVDAGLICNHFLARNYSFMLLEREIDDPQTKVTV